MKIGLILLFIFNLFMAIALCIGFKKKLKAEIDVQMNRVCFIISLCLVIIWVALIVTVLLV